MCARAPMDRDDCFRSNLAIFCHNRINSMICKHRQGESNHSRSCNRPQRTAAITKHSLKEEDNEMDSVIKSKRQHNQRERSFSGRLYVDHTYNDHLYDPYVDESDQSYDETGEAKHKKGPRGGVSLPFPCRLHSMLTSVTEEGLDTTVVGWLPHGRSFIVHDKKKFVEEIMPRFFHQSKFTSFQRQLNLYGFVRLTAGRDRGAYYHELFLRGRPDLCKRMVRTRVKGNGMKAASNPNQEPNFYAMEAATADGAEPFEADRVPSFVTSIEDVAIADPYPSSSTSAPDITGTPCSSDDEDEKQKHPLPLVSPDHRPKTKSIKDLWPVTNTTPLVSLAADIVIPRFVEDDMDEDDDFEELLPRNGDEVFFEGQSFHYLDAVGFEDLATVFSASQVNSFAEV